MKKFLLLMVSFVLVSCASQPTPELERPPVMVEQPPVPAAAPAAPPVPKPSSEVYIPPKAAVIAGSASGVYSFSKPSSLNILFKAYLHPKTKVNPDLLTFVYLPKKPVTETEIKQYENICKVWSNVLLYREELEPHINKQTDQLVPFYWPVKTEVGGLNCEERIKNYDYGRMFILMRKNKLDTDTIQLVSIYKSVNVTMNISPLTEGEDLVNSFVAWKSYMTKTPSKTEKVDPITLGQSVKKVLGALGYLVTSSFKG